MLTNQELANRVFIWLAARPGWHTLGAVRKGAELGTDDKYFARHGFYMPSLRGIVRDLVKAGKVETRGGWDRTFEVRAKE